MATDYYQLLGVERTADAGEIKRAFRRRARELHPDVNPAEDAEEQFREVTAAYEVLSDDERRAIYDKYGEAGLKQQHWEPQFASFGNIADIFSAFFGDDLFGQAAGRGRRHTGNRGENVLVEVELDFAEAALGTQREIVYDAVARCETCNGDGAATPEGIAPCEQCDGHGAVRTVSRSIFGQVIQESVCPRCAGRGTVVTDPCADCGGTGEKSEQQSVTVEIPAGISAGQRIRLTGRGGVGSGGGAPGNLYVDVRVRDDERFVRDGDDLVTVLDVTLAEAALGCIKHVPSIEGDDEQIELPAGVQPGEVVVLEGRGVGRLRGGGRGDVRAVVNVQVPKGLSTEQREVLEAFAELESDANYRMDDGLFDKLRRILRG
jgi:molecular chaperone DnaJ